MAPPILILRDIGLTFGSTPLLEGAELSVSERDRICLVGRNGSGKSTLLKIAAGLVESDTGEFFLQPGTTVRYLPQEPDFLGFKSTLDYAQAGLQPGDDPYRVDYLFEQLGLTGEEDPSTLSGGEARRAALVRALAPEPDILLLDEPTNHLDVEAIEWLEGELRNIRSALVLISHDRRFLENCASRILELAPSYPDGAFEVNGNYTEFVRRKEAFLISQEAEESALANKVRRDTAWLRQGIQGRQTRNKTQVKDTASRRAELKSVNTRNLSPTKRAGINFDAVGRKTNKLLVMHSVEKSMGNKLLFQDLDLELTPGRRIGLVGPNGSGKTTLLRLINGELQQDGGTIKRADKLRVVTASQHRLFLDPSITLQDTLCPIGEMVNYMGNEIHVSGWATRFLFSREQLGTLVGSLSGGEQARIQIASLMLQPADILLLDEPTNDLDIPTLEVLEEALLDFPGAILLITHDRFMLDRIATEYLALDGKGTAKEFASFEQWEVWRKKKPKTKTLPTSNPSKKRVKSASVKLTYILQREFDGMEKAIAVAEAEVERAELIVNDKALMENHKKHAKACADVASAHGTVRALYDRWAELEKMQ